MVEFQTADVQNLPFENNIFDTVIGEAIIAFVKNKQRAVNECTRVVKPRGYIGFNEPTWIKTPPPDIVEHYSRVTGAKPETPNNWKEIMKKSGLKNIEVRTHKLSLSDAIETIKLYGLKNALKFGYKLLSPYAKSPDFRIYTKKMKPPKNITQYLGYEIYTGRREQ